MKTWIMFFMNYVFFSCNCREKRSTCLVREYCNLGIYDWWFLPKTKTKKKLNLCLSSANLWLALCMENELSVPADGLIIWRLLILLLGSHHQSVFDSDTPKHIKKKQPMISNKWLHYNWGISISSLSPYMIFPGKNKTKTNWLISS